MRKNPTEATDKDNHLRDFSNALRKYRCFVENDALGRHNSGQTANLVESPDFATERELLRITRLNGERGRTRTCDPCLKRALLYQLSYAPALSTYYCIKLKIGRAHV